MRSRTRSIGCLASSADAARSSSVTFSTIWLVCPWSAVAITSVLPSFLAKSSAALNRLVEVDGLADLPARIGGVVALVDRSALDLEEEALVLDAPLGAP